MGAWVGVGFRIAIFMVLFAILGFAMGGFLGILAISLMRAAHLAITMQDALWFGAIPGAVAGAITGCVVITISEQRTQARKTSTALRS